MNVENSWYREPWPWILMAGPAAAVVAGAVTIWIAFASADGLVVDDYYKQGLAINRVLARDENARRAGIAARVLITSGQGSGKAGIDVVLGGRVDLPEELVVRLSHASRAGNDREVRLRHVDANRYAAMLPPLPAGNWRVSVEDTQGQWRVTGNWRGEGLPFTAAAP
jgi:hypothetical protein